LYIAQGKKSKAKEWQKGIRDNMAQVHYIIKGLGKEVSI
jgi:hypothetical protein